ncbi:MULTISPECIES: NAD(P)/FAD-dependent oxidoreductase [unclassified Rhodococcus (in: high G+C Gram-positive bacteria)]|uniref:NAD(P)/FAD-dependent oxidoreductase n=1 Tax=unclassified Rhodococcus (in: high G+C Gram-positive bacteria) TaxID=192944 RepID=UPI00163998C7|nr:MULTISPECIES: FAD/NAD(P)-binding oxidoreductase [unclassified Rhodococcus (in: high G+C Gram-positive bacteria)]MBC2637821.1 NAD(P)/FAD-dependent oxidoreductase [Rhodococcus sp. 3A]MBC2897432.1 NAD(P)/FAD-dependent oxidoreductase [Rhodococcus sp. 4CII]
MASQIVVVGGSLGGLRAAEQLRVNGWSGALTVVGAEAHLPYNRPPLSKNVLVSPDISALTAAELVDYPGVALRRRAQVEDVSFVLDTQVASAALSDRSLLTVDGRELAYDGLVIATGLRPRRLPIAGFDRHRHALRTLDDAIALRGQLTPGTAVVVVGGGFIGCEVAASACRLGCQVTVVEPFAAPMLRPLGAELARTVQTFHEDKGVSFRLGRSVSTLAGRASDPATLGAVVLDDGTELEADVLVEAVGSNPNVEWLAGNGLDLSDGVLCDNMMRVEARENVVAVGDVARFPNPRFGSTPRRVEHWCIPADTAHRAATTLIRGLSTAENGDRDPAPFAPLPSFWSDQFDVRIQGFGRTEHADRIEVLEGGFAPGWVSEGVVVGYFRQSTMTGVVIAGGTPAQRLRHKTLLEGVG